MLWPRLLNSDYCDIKMNSMTPLFTNYKKKQISNYPGLLFKLSQFSRLTQDHLVLVVSEFFYW